MDNGSTIQFSVVSEREREIRKIINDVYLALKEKGYNPVNQMVGYVMSGDPTYITSHNNARSLITKIERDEIVEELFKSFIASESNSKENQ